VKVDRYNASWFSKYLSEEDEKESGLVLSPSRPLEGEGLKDLKIGWKKRKKPGRSPTT